MARDNWKIPTHMWVHAMVAPGASGGVTLPLRGLKIVVEGALSTAPMDMVTPMSGPGLVTMEKIRNGFQMEPTDSGQGMTARCKNFCLAHDGSNGNIQLESCSGNNNQKLVVEDQDNFFQSEWHSIRFKSGMQACVRSTAKWDGDTPVGNANANVHTGGCNGHSGNKWKWDTATKQTKNSRGGCFCVSTNRNVDLHKCQSGEDQQWWTDNFNQIRSFHSDCNQQCLIRTDNSNIRMTGCTLQSDKQTPVSDSIFRKFLLTMTAAKSNFSLWMKTVANASGLVSRMTESTQKLAMQIVVSPSGSVMLEPSTSGILLEGALCWKHSWCS